jgi:NAD(P)-dependent dehydrogenase (short-subunit alcohol dehydrogenase family)
VNVSGSPPRSVVVGSSGGIGGAAARRLVADGHHVIGVDRVPAVRAGDVAEMHTVELADTAAVEACCDDIVGAGHPLWALVYTAGRYPDVAFDDYGVDLWSAVFAVNVTAAFVMAQRLAPVIAPGGRIVMVVSGGAYAGSTDVGYASSKSAQLGLMKSLARNLAARDIRVNAISPGPIDTPMLRGMAPANTVGFINGGLVPRLGRPEEIASAVSFLVAADNSYMTGATVDVNGGMQIR